MSLRPEPPTDLLTAEAERRLARSIEAGVLAEHLLATGGRPVPVTDAELAELAAEGRRCWQRFLLANTRLVWKIAGSQARHSRMPVDELFQEGFIALAGALQRFDPDRGRFSTLATTRIEQHLAEVGASRLGEVALPPSRAVQWRRARGLASELAQLHGRTASMAELAAELDQSTSWTRRLLWHRRPVSLDSFDVDDLTDPRAAVPESGIFAAQVRRLLDRLEPDQASVLALRYGLAGEPLSHVQVANRLRISVSSAKRLERAALATLRTIVDPDDAADLAG